MGLFKEEKKVGPGGEPGLRTDPEDVTREADSNTGEPLSESKPWAEIKAEIEEVRKKYNGNIPPLKLDANGNMTIKIDDVGLINIPPGSLNGLGNK